MAPVSAAAGGILAILLIPAMLLGHAAAQPYTYAVQAGTDYPGNDIHTTDGPMNPGQCGPIAYNEDASACEGRCDAAAVCAGFVHTADNNCCYLKSAMANPTALWRTSSHLKTGYPGYTIEYGQDYPNNDIYPGAGDPMDPGMCGASGFVLDAGACIARCDNTRACVGIAHYAYNSCCYLKSALANKTPNARVASYKKIYPCPMFADRCDWFFEGSGPGNPTPTFSLGSGQGDRGISPPIVYKNEQSVRVVNTNGGYSYAPGGIPHENQNQFYGNGDRIYSRTFNAPVNVKDYGGRCFLVPLTQIELFDGTNLNPGDGNNAYPESRRCVVFATQPFTGAFTE